MNHNTKRRTCPTPTKSAYPNRTIAQRAMYKMWANPRKGGQHLPLRTYHCACGQWHTTSQPRRTETVAA